MNQQKTKVGLTMLPYRLRIASLAKQDLKDSAYAILKIVLFKRSNFFSFTETNQEISLILEQEDVAFFPRESLHLSPKTFRVFEAALEDETSKSIVSALSHPLGRASVSILYHSSFQTDLVMIAEPDIPRALSILSKDFNISTESILSEVNLSDSSSGLEDQLEDPDPIFNQDFSRSFKLDINSDQSFHLISVSKGQISTQALCFIFNEVTQGDAQPNKPCGDKFFMYCQVEDEVSMILSEEKKAILERDDVNFGVFNESLSRITIDEGPLGFDQAGIVSSMAVPLTEANINLFYLSTYSTDHILVTSDALERSLAILTEKVIQTHFNSSSVQKK